MVNFEEIYITSVTTVAVALIGWFTTRLSNYLTEKFDTHKKERLQKLLKDAKEELKECVRNAIIETEETFVSTLRKDGNFSEQDAIIAKSKTIERVKELLSVIALNTFEQLSIPIDEVIGNQIEIQLPFLKAGGIIK